MNIKKLKPHQRLQSKSGYKDIKTQFLVTAAQILFKSHLDFKNTQDLPLGTEFDFPGWQHFYKCVGFWLTES